MNYVIGHVDPKFSPALSKELKTKLLPILVPKSFSHLLLLMLKFSTLCWLHYYYLLSYHTC